MPPHRRQRGIPFADRIVLALRGFPGHDIRIPRWRLVYPGDISAARQRQMHFSPDAEFVIDHILAVDVFDTHAHGHGELWALIKWEGELCNLIYILVLYLQYCI